MEKEFNENPFKKNTMKNGEGSLAPYVKVLPKVG